MKPLTSIAAVACYLRVSTENQIENYSIDEQRERLEAYCKAKGWQSPKMYIDPGYSGGSMERPALKKLIDDIKAHRIDTVIVYKLDRLSRSQKDTLFLIEDVFLRNNVDFVSINENFDTSTPFGKAMIGILSVFAQLEKDQITERFTMGRIGRAKNGLYHGGACAPFGYDYIDGQLVVNEYHAMQVREAFNKFMKGQSINSIQRELHETYGNWNSANIVLQILRNSVYCGKVKFAKQEYEGKHQPIVSQALFYDVQSMLGLRAASHTELQKNPFRAGYLLSGLIWCGNCGAKYHANHGYYRCYSRAKSDKKFIVDPTCKNANLVISELDDFVKREIRHLKLNPDIVKPELQEEDPEEKRKAIEKRITEIDGQLEKLLDLYQMGTIPAEKINQRIAPLQKEKEILENTLEDLPKIFISKKKEFFDLLAKCDEVLDVATTDEQRLFIGRLVRKIIIEPDGNVTIKWRI